MFWFGFAAGMLVPIGLVPLCATVLLRRWLANEGFEDPDDDDDDEFDWDAPRMPTNSREAFEASYRLTHPQASFGDNMVALPCTCEDGGGPTHWAAIRNTADAIAAHHEHEQLLRDIRQETSQPSDPRGGQHATPARMETPSVQDVCAATLQPIRKFGIIVPCPRLTDDPSHIDDAWIDEQRARLVAKQVEREQAEWDAVFGADRPRRTDVELDALADTIRRNA